MKPKLQPTALLQSVKFNFICETSRAASPGTGMPGMLYLRRDNRQGTHSRSNQRHFQRH